MEQTLILQNPQWNGKPFKRIVDREVMNNLRKKYDLPHIQILTGVRRCGKSTAASKSIITYNQGGQNDDIRIVPLWEWILE